MGFIYICLYATPQFTKRAISEIQGVRSYGDTSVIYIYIVKCLFSFFCIFEAKLKKMRIILSTEQLNHY